MSNSAETEKSDCPKCGSSKTKDTNYVYLDGHTILEYDICCAECGQILAHWAYGSFVGE